MTVCHALVLFLSTSTVFSVTNSVRPVFVRLQCVNARHKTVAVSRLSQAINHVDISTLWYICIYICKSCSVYSASRIHATEDSELLNDCRNLTRKIAEDIFCLTIVKQKMSSAIFLVKFLQSFNCTFQQSGYLVTWIWDALATWR